MPENPNSDRIADMLRNRAEIVKVLDPASLLSQAERASFKDESYAAWVATVRATQVLLQSYSADLHAILRHMLDSGDDISAGFDTIFFARGSRYDELLQYVTMSFEGKSTEVGDNRWLTNATFFKADSNLYDTLKGFPMQAKSKAEDGFFRFDFTKGVKVADPQKGVQSIVGIDFYGEHNSKLPTRNIGSIFYHSDDIRVQYLTNPNPDKFNVFSINEPFNWEPGDNLSAGREINYRLCQDGHLRRTTQLSKLTLEEEISFILDRLNLKGINLNASGLEGKFDSDLQNSH